MYTYFIWNSNTGKEIVANIYRYVNAMDIATVLAERIDGERVSVTDQSWNRVYSVVRYNPDLGDFEPVVSYDLEDL